MSTLQRALPCAFESRTWVLHKGCPLTDLSGRPRMYFLPGYDSRQIRYVLPTDYGSHSKIDLATACDLPSMIAFPVNSSNATGYGEVADGEVDLPFAQEGTIYRRWPYRHE